MSYLVVVPCLLAVHVFARHSQLPTAIFYAVFVGFWGLLYGGQLVIPGAEALVAMCLTFACVLTAERYLDSLDEFSEATDVAATSAVPQDWFCSRLTHDFSALPEQSTFAVALINTREFGTLLARLKSFTTAQRQGFYASLNYSSVSERSVSKLIKQYPASVDARVLMGHLQLCKAKRLGLQQGQLNDEHCAATIANALRHFREALEMDATDAEACCGILIGKVYLGLGRRQVERSLVATLERDSGHFHAVLTAGRQLIVDGDSANRFVETVTAAVADRNPTGTTVALAGLIAHIECRMIFGSGDGLSEAGAAQDLHSLYHCFETHRAELGDWQWQMAANLHAAALQQMGFSKQAAQVLGTMAGRASPYPWQLIGRGAQQSAVNARQAMQSGQLLA